MKMMLTRKAQQEIFGFVIIIVMVLVIGVIFFGLVLQRSMNKPEFKEYQQVNDFLFSVMHYTTSCKNKPISGVFQLCVDDKSCDQQTEACDFLKEKLSDILNKTMGDETNIIGKPIHGYHLVSEGEKINITAGWLNGSVVSGSYLVPLSSGSIGLTLYFYY